MVNDLDYEGIIVRWNRKIIFALMYFVMKMNWLILLMYQIKNLITDENKSHYV